MKSQNCISEWVEFLLIVQSISWGSPRLLACPYSWSSPVPATPNTCIGNTKQLCCSHLAQVTKTRSCPPAVSQSLTCRCCRQDLEDCCDTFWFSMLSKQEEEARKKGHLKSLKLKNEDFKDMFWNWHAEHFLGNWWLFIFCLGMCVCSGVF